MSREQRPEHISDGTPAEDAALSSSDSEQGMVSNIASTLGNHKGKLAIGAAAMLGLAVFYKWREHWLAKNDPDEYARLRRLKAAVGAGKVSQPPNSPRKR